MRIKSNSKLIMIGDSVSDFDRARPVGEGLAGALGRSYVALVDALLRTAYPESKIRIVNMSVSGNTVRDLKNRWETDVLELKPDWVSILIGTNDVWRQFDSPLASDSHVYPEEYESTLESLVEKTISKTSGFVLMTPFYMEPNREDPMRARMDEYGAIVKRTAKKYNTICVDLQAEFDKYLRYYYSASMTWDRVHPDIVGHTIIARAFLNAIGFDWSRMA